MRKKREGSTILMVLMISTILIILSAVVSASLVSTTRGNSIQKRKSDYMYAAEGGIEQGVEKYNRNGAFSDFEVPFLETISKDSENGIEKVTVKYVVNPINTNSAKIVSTVTRGSKKLSEIALPINMLHGNSADVLKNSIFSSESVTITSIGSSSLQSSNIIYNPANGGSVNIPSVGTLPTNNANMEGSAQTPMFKNIVVKHVGNIEVSSLEELFALGTQMSFTVNNNPSDLNGKLSNGIGYYELDNLITPSDPSYDSSILYGSAFKLILVDSDKLTIKLNATATSDKYIVICSGEIEIKSDTVGTYHLTRSTLYGKGVSVLGSAAITMTGSPTNTGGGLNSLQTDELDILLNKYMLNWGLSSPGAGGGSNGIDYGNMEYITP